MDSFGNFGMRRQLAICLFALGVHAPWLPIAHAAANYQTPGSILSTRRTPIDAPNAADYIRTDFTVEDGLPDNVVDAIVETQNGVLWVGTQSGLASFDGRQFSPINFQAEGLPAQGAVHSLLESSSGDLWIGTQSGVVRIPKTGLDQFSPTLLTFYHLGLGPGDEVAALLQARDGGLWAGTNHGLYREASGKFVEVIADVSVSRIAETLDGHLLVINEGKVIEWDGHKVVPHPDLAASLGVPEGDIFDVFQAHDGTRWYSTHEGILRRGREPLQRLRPLAASTTAAFRTYEDPQGHLWVVSGTGVYRISGDVMEDTPVPNVLPRCFHADRDGGFWVGTNGNGLIHLKRRIVHMFARKDGLLSDIPMSVLSSYDGRLWVGCNCGLSLYDGKRFTSYSEKDGLSNSCVWSLAEDQNQNLWIATYGGGLFRFRDGRFTQYSLEQGLPSKIVLQVIVAHDGSLWMATTEGISHLQNGHFRNYTIADGLSSNQAHAIYQDRSGTVWAATQGGLDRLIGERFVPLFSAPPQDGPSVVRLAEDSLGNLYTADSPKGFSVLKNNELVMVNDELQVLGMVQSAGRDLWLSGTNGVLRVPLSDLQSSLDDHDAPLNYELIDRSDGLESIQCSVGRPNMAITRDNKLWVATVKGLAMLDLAHLPVVIQKPTVLIGAVVDGKSNSPSGSGTVLPPGTHHVELHLGAVDIASPEKIRLQYRLDGVDTLWLDANASRTAVYSNIPLGAHAFHVRATDRNGVWDRTGIAYSITQRPYFYQTTWFLLLCVAALAFLAWEASQWRMRQARAQAHIQMEERLSERARIARELHDTLLQSFQGLILNFQRARNLLPAQPDRAIESLGVALDRAERAIMEGRDAIHDMRASAPADGDFANEISLLGKELASEKEHSGSPTFGLVVEGSPKTIQAAVRDQIYRIAREALRNAYGHAQARTIEAEIRYEEKLLRVRIRDDGIGINETHLGEVGRAGHYGLRGMRERAAQIGAQLDVWSESGAGTEIELRVPDEIAYKADGRVG
jgi:signal transduction histidine kinase/ligand-binding sensor domain-containing protein